VDVLDPVAVVGSDAEMIGAEELEGIDLAPGWQRRWRGAALRFLLIRAALGAPTGLPALRLRVLPLAPCARRPAPLTALARLRTVRPAPAPEPGVAPFGPSRSLTCYATLPAWLTRCGTVSAEASLRQWTVRLPVGAEARLTGLARLAGLAGLARSLPLLPGTASPSPSATAHQASTMP